MRRHAGCGARRRAGPGELPVSSVVAVDATGSIHDPALARDVSSAALRAAEHTITAGGRLRMVVFAGDANSVEVIYDDEVPTLKQSDETRRGPLEQDLRTALGSTLDGALGVDRSDPPLAGRVRDLARGGTSDIARAVRNGLRTLQQGSGARAMTLISDGVQASDQLELAGRLQAGDAPGPLRRSWAICSATPKGSTCCRSSGSVACPAASMRARGEPTSSCRSGGWPVRGPARRTARRRRSCEAAMSEEDPMQPEDPTLGRPEEHVPDLPRPLLAIPAIGEPAEAPATASARSRMARCPHRTCTTDGGPMPPIRGMTPIAFAGRSSRRASLSTPITSSARGSGRCSSARSGSGRSMTT